MKKIYKLLFGLLVAICLTGYVNASSAKISVSSTGQVVVGNTFEVKVTLSSSSKIGTWEFSINYDSSKFKMTSGNKSVKDYGPKKSKTYTYKFKAIGTGSGKISISNPLLLDYSTEDKMSVSTGSKTVKVITQKELEASYSKDNYLKKLSIDGLTLSPAFKKDTLEYTAEANSNTTQINIKATKNDSRASVSGTGKKEVAEGENLFKITVKAQNGSTRTYKITVNVVDPNPITVNVDGKDYTIVKRKSILTCPNDYEETTIKINDIDVPAFYNETNNYTLVGLKNSEETTLFIYNSEDNSYKKYYSLELDNLNIYPLDMDKDLDENYKKEELTIKDAIVDALHLQDTDYYVLNARNLTTGKNNYYLYDKQLGSAIRSIEAKAEKEIVNVVTKDDSKTKKYKTLILVLTVTCALSVIITLFSLVSKSKSKKKLNFLIEKINEEKQTKKEEEKEQEEVKETTTKKRGRPKKA